MTKWKPKSKERVFLPYVSNGIGEVISYIWTGSEHNKDVLMSGIVCKTKDDAIKLAEKMLGVVEA